VILQFPDPPRKELARRLLVPGQGLRRMAMRMRAFNDEEIVIAVGNWRRVALRLLHAASLGPSAA